MADDNLFNKLGGRATLDRVHKIFYDKVFEHPWMKSFFADVDRDAIEKQQTDFMTSNMGGGKIYCGGLPKPVHKHMFITDELYDLRQEMLKEAMVECGIDEELIERWIKIDDAFRGSLVKESVDQCEKRYATDTLLVHPKPAKS
jgi:hemoglobin